MPIWREISSSSEEEEDPVPSEQTNFMCWGFTSLQALTQEQLDYLECGKHFVHLSGFFSGIRAWKITSFTGSTFWISAPS